jgi:hypothetical protein
MTALAARAGLLCTLGDTFDYGVDGTLRLVKRWNNGRRAASGTILDFQLKATTEWEIDPGDQHIIYGLERKTYNDMVGRGPEESPLMLILLCLDKDQNKWLTSTTDELVLRKCCYWHLVSGSPSPTEAGRIDIHLPLQNRLDEASIISIVANENARMKSLMK